MNQISHILKNNNLHIASVDDIKMFFKNNKDLYFNFNSFWKNLDPNYSKNLKYRVMHTIAAFPQLENLVDYIEQFLIDSEGEVSPSKIFYLNKINPQFNGIIIEATKSFPFDFKIVGRCELLRKGIFNFPKCINCENPVSWMNSSKLLTFCSKKCSDSSSHTKEKRKSTMTELYGVDYYSQNENFNIKTRATKKERYSDEKYTNREKYKTTCLDLYGVDNTLKIKEVKEKSKRTMKERYGFENYVEHPDFKHKSETTCMKNYGVKKSILSKTVKEKAKATMKKRYGVENYVEHSDFKNKSEIACLNNYGFRSCTQSPEIYQKILNSLYTVKKYKNTDLLYQGSYELYFLEQMEERGFLNEISNSNPYSYIFNNKEHIYNPDFEFRGKIVEIKSTWTYNRNGADKILESKNHTKWDAVRNKGKEIIVLIEKDEIIEYINSID